MSPSRERARVGLLLADDHPEQRRLAGAVGADHADDARRRQREREVLDQQPVAEALAHVVGLDHLAAEPLAGRDVDLDLVELDVALLGEQALVVGQARLGLLAPALGVRRAPTRARCCDRALARGLLALLLRQARLLLLEPARVVALEREAVAAVELEDPARDVVEEVAIVGDGHDGALVLLEVALEPARPTRRRGGWWARRAAAGRARSAAAGRARRGGARRRRACVTSASAGGRRSASIAVSSWVSRFQASAASICSCRRANSSAVSSE